MSEKLLRVVLVAVACLSLFATRAHGQGQDIADWQGGNGNFTNANQWLCDGPDFVMPSPCVPNGSQFVLNQSSGTVNIDTNVTVFSLGAGPASSLSLNGTSLTLGQSSLAVTLASLQLTNGAAINNSTGSFGVVNLNMQNSTVNSELSVSGSGNVSGTANISGSIVQTLLVDGSFTISNSTLGDNSTLVNAGQSIISGTSFNGLLALVESGSVVMDNGSKINSVIFGTPVGVNVGSAPGSSATLTIQGGSQLNVSGANLVLGAPQNTSGTVVLSATSSTTANKEQIGILGTGQFTQTGGTNTVKQLFLGDQPGSTGTYNLSGGALTILGTIEIQNFTVGNDGTGVFNQSGGTVSLPKLTLYLGFGESGNGSYFQTGGTNTVGSLNLASTQCFVPIPCSSGRATYSLGGSAVLTAGSGSVGDNGTGVFNQDGGTNSVISGLSLGGQGGQGTYNLNDGKLAAGSEIIGDRGGIGSFNQSGGMNVTGSIDINFNSFSANPNDVYNLSGGALSAGTITNFGTFNYSGGNLTGIFYNRRGANFNISGAGTVVVNGTLTNAGTVTVNSQNAQFFNVNLPSGVFNADPTAVEFQNLTVGAAGVIIGAAGDVFSITGNFQNLSTQNTLWDTSSSLLDFTGGGTHTFDLAGQNGAGFANNFAWGTLVIDAGNILALGTGSGDALYVNFLQGLDISGNLITNIDGAAGLFLYYNAADNPFLQGNYNLEGGGELIAANGPAPTPEPATLLLMATGLGLLMRRRGWRRTRNSPTTW